MQWCPKLMAGHHWGCTYAFKCLFTHTCILSHSLVHRCSHDAILIRTWCCRWTAAWFNTEPVRQCYATRPDHLLHQQRDPYWLFKGPKVQMKSSQHHLKTFFFHDDKNILEVFRSLILWKCEHFRVFSVSLLLRNIFKVTMKESFLRSSVIFLSSYAQNGYYLMVSSWDVEKLSRHFVNSCYILIHCIISYGSFGVFLFSFSLLLPHVRRNVHLVCAFINSIFIPIECY